MWIIFSTFPIEGRLLDYEKKVSQEHGVNLIVKWLGVGEAVAVKACKKEFGAYISYTILQELYEEHLIIATQMEVPHRGTSCRRCKI